MNDSSERTTTDEEESGDKLQTAIAESEVNETEKVDSGSVVNISETILTAQDKNETDDPEKSGENDEETETTEGADSENEKCGDRACESEGQADIIAIKGFNKESVRIVFGYLAGYTEKLDQCSDFMILSDMLLLCNKYGIKNLVDKIIARIENCNINIDSLMAAVEAAEILEGVAGFGSASEKLYQRCLGYARSNLASWQVIINFILNNKSRKGDVVKVCEALKNDSSVTIRRRIEDISKLTEKGPSYVVKNLLWRIVCKKTVTNGLGLLVNVENPNSSSSWSCDASIRLSLVNQDTGDLFSRHFTFNAGKKSEGFQSFMPWSQVENGYMKDNTLLVEAEIIVLNVGGIEETFGKAEEEIGWFYGSMDVSEFEEDDFVTECDQEENEEEDLPVILRCENSFVSVRESTLVAQSKYFKARLSSNWSKKSGRALVEEDDDDFSRMRTINISSSDPTAVKFLFEHIEGYPQMMKHCQDFDVLAEMLLLCDYYMMAEPVEVILDRMENTPVTADNLVTAFETGKKLEINDRLKSVAAVLIRRSLTFAGANLASWQCMLSFIVNNRDNMDSVVKICQFLGGKEKCVIKSRFDGVSCFQQGALKFSTSHVNANLIWRISARKQIYNGQSYLGVYLNCKSDDVTTQKWSCQLQPILFFLHKHKSNLCWQSEISSTKLESYGDQSCGDESMKLWSEMLAEEKDYVKDDSILVEIEFRVKSTSGISTSLGIPETMIR